MLPILYLSSFIYSLTPKFSCLIFSFSSIVSIILFLPIFPPFHHLQCLSSLPQYSWSYLLSDQPNNFLAVNLSSNSLLSQTSFDHISINSSTILTALIAMESPQKDLSIDASHVSRQSVLAEILSRSTSNHYVTVY